MFLHIFIHHLFIAIATAGGRARGQQRVHPHEGEGRRGDWYQGAAHQVPSHHHADPGTCALTLQAPQPPPCHLTTTRHSYLNIQVHIRNPVALGIMLPKGPSK